MSALRTDAIANLVAFGVLAVSGVTLNLALVGIAGEAALGVFNQLYAVYVVASQLVVLGLHDSVHQDTAAQPGDVAGQHASLASGLALVAVTGSAGALVLLALSGASGVVGHVVGSEAVGAGVVWLAPALGLFAVNKVLMSALAGRRRLVAFAVLQVVRILALVGVTLAVAALGEHFGERLGAPAGALAAGFGAAELAIVLPLWGLLRPDLRLATRERAQRHLAFGVRALPHGFIAESFLRVDVLMLAPWVDDAAIGVYSLAAMCGEGLVQVGGTVRNVVGPRLVPTLAPGGDPEARRALLRRGMGLGLGAFGLVAVAVAVAFPGLGWVLDPGVVADAYGVLLVLMVGLACNAAFLPLDGLLLWSGRPGRQSAWMALNLGANVALNLALIPQLGIRGAALATALAWGFAALSLQAATWRWLGFRGGVVAEALRRQAG